MRPALGVENDGSLSVCKFQAGWCLKHDTALSRSAPRVRRQKLMTFYAGEELDVVTWDRSHLSKKTVFKHKYSCFCLNLC